MTLAYAVRLTPDDNGTLLVTCPALPEVTTFGEDRTDALLNAGRAIEEAIAARIADGRDVPVPQVKAGSRVILPTQTALKVSLYRALKRENITRAELSRRLNWKREQVDRLFRLGHATRLDQFDAAFKALDRQVRVSVD
ncbi:MAG: type II toxin-antitoxin system HicB family antitoxin [Methyloceanibacter sp.]|uniref:type II toxin-antitoxin system HicB family antitoxin n=1 Tax=Methyloceanibacter sp. TaxID=1965321 RepID=UPI003D6D61ED